MIEKVYPPSLYNYLWYIRSNPTGNRILDCGAGGCDPKLAFFLENGFEAYGIDISDEQIKDSEEFSAKNNINLNIIKGDMRKIPFDSGFFDYVYSYNSIFHLSKKDSRVAINEMHRVLKKGGLCYLNFLSVDDKWSKEGEEINPGEIITKEDDEEYLHSYYEDDEPDSYFDEFEIIYKEKIHIHIGRYYNTGRSCILEYITRKV
ncbi:MAG: class I SAM-dependent methyltransferase [Candidatus Lokiarchaeota archaeon]|nr:class I SAM-dependent methyltransferase [Candidatus Lokiarchaeota archaeon]